MTTTKFNHHPSGRGVCYKCGEPWTDSQQRTCIYYTATSGMYPLCNTCWDSSDVHERVAYAAMLYGSWCGQSHYSGHIPEEPFELIEAAVLRMSGVYTVPPEIPREISGHQTRQLEG
jgi:hypothetical protein